MWLFKKNLYLRKIYFQGCKIQFPYHFLCHINLKRMNYSNKKWSGHQRCGLHSSEMLMMPQGRFPSLSVLQLAKENLCFCPSCLKKFIFSKQKLIKQCKKLNVQEKAAKYNET